MTGFTLNKVTNIPPRGSLDNKRKREYDELADQLRQNPGESFCLRKGDGSQSHVNALKSRGIFATLRNTDGKGHGDLYAVFNPEGLFDPANPPKTDENGEGGQGSAPTAPDSAPSAPETHGGQSSAPQVPATAPGPQNAPGTAAPNPNPVNVGPGPLPPAAAPRT